MKTLSGVAQCAKWVRMELKNKYPDIKFRVISSSFANGDSVDVGYTDGVPVEQVDKLLAKYEYGHFDGMTDCYEYSNSNEELPQTKYLSVSREISQANRDLVQAEIMKEYGMTEWSDEACWKLFHMWSFERLNMEMRDRTFLTQK